MWHLIFRRESDGENISLREVEFTLPNSIPAVGDTIVRGGFKAELKVVRRTFDFARLLIFLYVE